MEISGMGCSWLVHSCGTSQFLGLKVGEGAILQMIDGGVG